MLRSKGVDGIILATVLKDDPNILPLIEDEFPFVLINRHSWTLFLKIKQVMWFWTTSGAATWEWSTFIDSDMIESPSSRGTSTPLQPFYGQKVR